MEQKKMATSMTGFKKAKGGEGRLGGGSRRVATIDQFMKNLDTQVLMMEKTDEQLVDRLK